MDTITINGRAYPNVPKGIADYALSDLTRSTLEDVSYLHSQGRITGEVWAAYKHVWQSATPRFATQICHCPECKADPHYPRDADQNER